MGQYTIWEALQKDGTLADSSTILTAFSLMANNSRFSLFTKIETAIDTGDIATAQALLDAYGKDDLNNNQVDTTTGVQMADDTTADNIVINYRQFYQLYINYADSALSGSDSAAIETMAKLCPITNGAVVYKARALYDIVFDTLRFFQSNCGDDVVFDSSAARHGAPQLSQGGSIVQVGSGEKYTLYPNPNDGTFILHQSVADDNPVQVEVWDAVGRTIFKEEVGFVNSSSYMAIKNVMPGLYLLQVTDNDGKKFKFKFAVE
jgi:hypothetical protein